MCILSVYALLKVVGYYDLSVLSMSVMVFQKKNSLDGGWVGGVSSIHIFLNFFNFAKPLRHLPHELLTHFKFSFYYIAAWASQFVCDDRK